MHAGLQLEFRLTCLQKVQVSVLRKLTQRMANCNCILLTNSYLPHKKPHSPGLGELSQVHMPFSLTANHMYLPQSIDLSRRLY